MAHHRRLPLSLLGCCLFVLAAGEAGAPGTPARLSVEPASIPIGASYSGATVRVEAEVPAGYEAAIRVLGTPETLEMKRKGKVAHLLWMSVGEATFENVPSLYFLLTSAALAPAAPQGALREWKLGYTALAGAAGWDVRLAPELIRLKEQEGCFSVGEGKLLRASGAPAAATDRWSGQFQLPAQAPAGEYAVDLFALHDQQVIHLATTTLRLEYTGLVRVLRSAATEHGSLYGGVAIVVALLAGLLTGFVFHPKRGKGK